MYVNACRVKDKKSGWPDSNWRSPAPKAGALATRLHPVKAGGSIGKGTLAVNIDTLDIVQFVRSAVYFTREEPQMIALDRQIQSIYNALSSSLLQPEPGLRTRSCYELLVSVILSAQTTDAQVNQVTGPLFSRFPDARALAAAKQEEVEKIIYTTGFYRVKARNIRSAAKFLLDRFDGVVPATIAELVEIPGVGRKSANVIIGHCFGKPAIIVDTHFSRVVQRVGLTEEKNPEKIERFMKAVVPEDIQYRFSMLIYLHGQSVCKARKPECDGCVIRTCCRFGSAEK